MSQTEKIKLKLKPESPIHNHIIDNIRIPYDDNKVKEDSESKPRKIIDKKLGENGNSDRLQFFYRSANKPVGKGNGEYVGDPTKYSVLNNISHWRRALSTLNSDYPFCYKGLTYSSVEHAVQAMKFTNYPETSRQFSRESKSELSVSSGLVARQARKIKILGFPEIAEWNLNRHQIKLEIYFCKFGSGLPQQILLGTHNAELWSAGPRIQKIRATTLEKIRDLYSDITRPNNQGVLR